MDKYNIGVLSRGYKRATKGFVLATPQSRPEDIGDESYQIYRKVWSGDYRGRMRETCRRHKPYAGD